MLRTLVYHNFYLDLSVEGATASEGIKEIENTYRHLSLKCWNRIENAKCDRYFILASHFSVFLKILTMFKQMVSKEKIIFSNMLMHDEDNFNQVLSGFT